METKEKEIKKNVSLHAKINNTPFNQKFVRPAEVGVLQWRKQTKRQTDILQMFPYYELGYK